MEKLFMNDTDKLKVSIWSDSPFITSGFGGVNKMIINECVNKGWDVSVLGALDFSFDPWKIKNSPFTYFPVTVQDAMGEAYAPEFIRLTNPDRIFMLGDPGSLDRRLYILEQTGALKSGARVITYFPVEGLPIFPSVVHQARSAHAPITYCKFGQSSLTALGAENVGQAYHGWDHYEPEIYTKEERKHLKTIFGFDGNFIVAQIAVNKRTNNQPKMIEAASYLKSVHPSIAKDVIIYLHCKAQDQHIMQGYDLTWMPHAYNVKDMVLIKPDSGEYKYAYEPYKDQTLNKDFYLNLKRPPKWEDRMALWANAPYTVKMNCFDLVIDPSSVQGFGLPPLEAIVTNVPAVLVNDGTCRTEIYGDVCYMIDANPESYSIWHLGTILVEISARQIGEAIVDWYTNYDKFIEIYQKPSYEKFIKWTWKEPVEYITTSIELGTTVF